MLGFLIYFYYLCKKYKMKDYNCKTCGEKDPLKFRLHSKGQCKSCNNKKCLERYHENPKRHNEIHNQYYDNNLIYIRLLSAKTRCKNKNIEFNINIKDIEDLIIKQNNKCIYSNIVFENNRNGIYSLSIDRIDSDKGYTINNIQLVCSSINQMKNNLKEKEFLDIIEKIYNNTKNK